MQQDGVRADQVTQVRGYADQMLRLKSNPTDPSNRRVSILVKNDNDPVPTLSAAKVVDGTTPLPGAVKCQSRQRPEPYRRVRRQLLILRPNRRLRRRSSLRQELHRSNPA